MSFFKSIHEALGVTPQEVASIRAAMPQSAIKKYLEYEIERAIYERSVNESPTTVEGLNKEMGIREGMRIAVGILNRPPK